MALIMQLPAASGTDPGPLRQQSCRRLSSSTLAAFVIMFNTAMHAVFPSHQTKEKAG